MKGFVITLTTVGLIALMVLLALSLRNSQLATERSLVDPLPLLYASAIVDDSAVALNSILGPSLSIYEDNSSVRILVSDRLYPRNYSSDITAFERFLSNDLSARTASNISANMTNLSAGTSRMYINEEYLYTNDFIQAETQFIRTGGATGASSYEVNITVPAVRGNVTETGFNESGPLNVTIRVTDLNGTFVTQGGVYPGATNTLSIDYLVGNSVVITAGNVGGNSGGLDINANGVDIRTSWLASLPPQNASRKLGYDYDATIDYVQGRVSKNSRIGK